MTSGSLRATHDDLMRTEGQAELIRGRIMRHALHTVAQANIIGSLFVSLFNHAEATGQGMAFTSTVGYAIQELHSGRESFSPDVSYYDGPAPANEMGFVQGAPTFAAEVRGQDDYTDAAEVERLKKRADYFAAGTQVVWDVDYLAKCVNCYRAAATDQPQTWKPGDTADAEPAVPGWRIAVDEIFA